MTNAVLQPTRETPVRQTPQPPRPDQIPAHRNLAIDALRVVAMCCVALGHWLAADVRVDTAGNIDGSNALNALTGFHWATWIFQVMPLFFFVGGYSNAASLESAGRRGTGAAEWIRVRLLRLLRPSAVFAGVWLTVVAVATPFGQQDMAVKASALAAIPLWFLAVYVIDIGLAPVVAKLVHTLGANVVALPLVVIALDQLNRAGVPYVSVLQVLFGWTCFQALGMAWHDGNVSRRLAATLAPIGLVGAVLGVASDRWPISLVSVPGEHMGNTWPPSPVLIGFGLAQCMLAMLAAPRIDAVLRRRPTVAKVVGGAGLHAMTIYLWHLTALSIVGVVGVLTGALGSPAIGSGSWWTQKLVLIVCAIPVLGALAAVLGRFEHATTPSRWSHARLVTTLPVIGVLAVSFHQLTEHGLTNLGGTLGALAIVGCTAGLIVSADYV